MLSGKFDSRKAMENEKGFHILPGAKAQRGEGSISAEPDPTATAQTAWVVRSQRHERARVGSAGMSVSGRNPCR